MTIGRYIGRKFKATAHGLTRKSKFCKNVFSEVFKMETPISLEMGSGSFR